MNCSCIVVNASDTQSDNPGSILGRGSPASEAVHPFGVDTFVAISRQWVTAVEFRRLRVDLKLCLRSVGLLRPASVP